MYLNNTADARKYNEKKNTKTGTCACSNCGKTIKMNGPNCIVFGVYACLKCRIALSQLKIAQENQWK